MAEIFSVQQLNVPQSYRDNILKWNGWGYQDSSFQLDEDNSVIFTGQRYEMSGKKLPYFREWFERNLGIDINHRARSCVRSELNPPQPINNQEFIDFLYSMNISYSNAPQHRIVRSHGHTVHEVMDLRKGNLKRIPDLIVWPKNELEVVKIVEGANDFNVVLIPIGGGTSVSNGLECSTDELRSICSLDMALMDKIIWIDEINLTCRAEAGIIGQSLERQLNEKGFTCGHEPDSMEFSSLGGWVATRASGMKKNKYGNIEDLLLHVNLVTTKGIVNKNCQVPRISSGPDIHHLVLGSEGIFGVITEVTLKIFPLPKVKRYGSIIFPTFQDGVECFREIAKQRCQPASLRLMDNEQFLMGQALKLEQSMWKKLSNGMNKLYIMKWKGFQPNEIVVATCVYEGDFDEVNAQELKINTISSDFNGIPAGEENGRYGYRLTFAIAYLRDFGMEFDVLGESFETSVSWNKVLILCTNVKRLIKREAIANGITRPVFASCRVTQIYDAGVCVYFYFGFNGADIENALGIYDKIEKAARDEIIACGGSISHHHGIGKLRKTWMKKTIGDLGISVIRSIKCDVDPKNIFANGNLIDIPKSKI